MPLSLTPVTQPCACGGAIRVVLVVDVDAAAAGVNDRRILVACMVHNRTSQHLAWSGPRLLAYGPITRPDPQLVAFVDDPLAQLVDDYDAPAGAGESVEASRG